MNSIDRVRLRFEARASQYDNPLTAFIGERELRAIRRLIPTGSAVLDYGCGTGRTTLDLLRRGCKVTAYDISPGMLSLAEAKALESGYQADFTADPLQLTGHAWQVVTCIGVLDYYRDPVPLLETLRSHLDPSGLLVLTFPNAMSPLAWIYVAASRSTVPCIARTPGFVRRSASAAGLQVESELYAFPAVRGLGHTLVAGLRVAGR